ncbi:MAG: heme-binding protein [Phycisphaerales bacterium]
MPGEAVREDPSMLIATLAFLASTFQPAGDAASAPTAPSESAPKAAARPEGAPAPGSSIRLVGDPAVKPVVGAEGCQLKEMGMVVEAPLPEGYPAPTPPGMIELKTYPSVRRAEYSASGSTNFGMNVGFWPLFNHIKDRNIAMTSPVEMDYRPEGDRAPLDPMKDTGGTWTMSFLYRTADLGPTGEDGRVKVVDNPEMTVIAIGMRGGYGMGSVNAGLEELSKWFAGQSEWEPAGEPRGLNYNGPQVPQRRKWSEVQVPVRRAAKKPDAANAAAAAPVTPAVPTAPAAQSHR